MIAVIKADAYGHGAVPVAHLIEDYDYIWGFAAATAEEAIHLREAGITKPILILGIVFDEYFPELVRYEIRPAVSELPNLEIEGMFTHFARADEYDRSPAMVQLERYLDFSRRVEEAGVEIPLHHCSNSAGIIRMPEANLNIVRAGITIYGIYPSSEVERDIVKLEPVMELKSHVTYVKDVPAGAAISYGGTYVADRKLRVATVPVGYADGYSRQLSNKGWVLIHGQKAPILGRVCMDQFMVDVTEIEEIGDLCGRFSYEFACDISPRVPRVYIKNGKEI